MSVIVDSNIILDILTEDPVWFEWSSAKLSYYSQREGLVINPLIFAEVSIRFKTIEELDEALPEAYFRREDLPWEAAFLAGKCFLAYRKKKGSQKRSPLPDFYIGAHAVITSRALLTRNSQDFGNYFPNLKVICPT